MIEENVQEQEEFPESKPAEKERFTDRVLTREVTLKGITFQMVDILFTACLFILALLRISGAMDGSNPDEWRMEIPFHGDFQLYIALYVYYDTAFLYQHQ